MQTIDLGTISIGGEDLGAPKRPEPTQAPRSSFPTREASRPAAPVAPPAPVIREPAVREPACFAPTAREPVSRETPRTRPTEEYCEECGASCPCNDDIYSKNARTTRSVTLETPSWRDRAAFWTLPCA